MDTARSEVESWQERERQYYESVEMETEVCAGQEFEFLPLFQGREGNPYTHGRSAFAVRGSWAICVEFLGQDSYEGDIQACLENFLDGFHYSDEVGGE